MARMIAEPEHYFRQLSAFNRVDLLCELEKQAREEKIPIVGPVVGQLLSVLIVAINAKQVLELGTAIGYSTYFLASACHITSGMVTTIDIDPDMAQRASYNLERVGLRHHVDIRVGDVSDELAFSRNVYDFIFLDTDKNTYLSSLTHCQRLLRRGGLLFVDNVAFTDAQPFNDAIHQNPAWRVVHLYSFLPGHSPEQDGLCLAVKLE